MNINMNSTLNLPGKRSRAANFTSEEIILLLNIIAKYKTIIECKKVDTMTCKKKSEAWINITNEFNMRTTSHIYRTLESLKKLYENKKKLVRHSNLTSCEQVLEAAKNNNRSNEQIFEMTLSLLHANSATDKFDSDVAGPSQYVIDENLEDTGECPAEHTNDANVQIEIFNELREQILANEESENINSNDSGSLKTPANFKIKTKRKMDWSKRQHSTTVPTDLPNDITVQYATLVRTKLELLEMKKEVLKTDTEIRRKREAEEFAMKKECLRLDLELKKVQLKKALSFDMY